MKSIQTATITGPGMLNKHDAYHVYNGLDCALTVEILQEIKGPNSSSISRAAQTVYDFERAMQAPALEMMLRGWKVDRLTRDLRVSQLQKEKLTLQKLLDEFVCVLWDGGRTPLDPKGKTPGLNPSSPKQMKEFFYGRLKIPEQYKFVKGERKLSTDREALEKIEDYFHASIFVRIILEIRKRSKQIAVLSSEVSADGRMRTSYNVTGTETGRWSSSRSAFDEGTNLQNITEELRDVLIADPGKKLAYIDKSQAESRALGFIIWKLFGDPSYLDACESGDLHTMVSKGIWPELAWTGVLKEDKEVAEQKFYLHFSYRDMAKRGGHATNYYGKPFTVAKHLKVRKELIERFQDGYLSSFPGIGEYHLWCSRQLGLHQYIETPLGMGRHFFGRPGDDSTLREAIAFVPQSMVGQLLNLALWRVWKYMSPKGVECIGQIHDAIVIQYPEERENELIPQVVKLMPTPLEARGRTMTIPSDVMVGWNFKKYSDGSKKPKNLDGLRGWNGNDDRKRTFDPARTGLDRVVP